MRKRLALIGSPTSAGAFAPGQEKAPEALRHAGLVERLTSSGIEVVDHGDGPVWRWRPDKENPLAQNLDAVVELARNAAARVSSALAQGQVPLVLGGDCTLELGTIAGHLPSEERLGLIYFDLHPDLNVPDSVGVGAIDWMGMAHVLGEPRAAEPLSHIGSRFPLLDDDEVVFFSYGPDNRTDWEREVMERRHLRGIPVQEVARDPEGSATRALTDLEPTIDRLLVHFDVDTIDFTDVPLSENAGRNEGLSFEHAMQALTVLLSSEKLSAVTVTEINPDHGEESGATMRLFVDALVRSLATSPILATSVSG